MVSTFKMPGGYEVSPWGGLEGMSSYEKPIGVQAKAIRNWLVHLACTESTYSGGVRYTHIGGATL